MVSEATRELPKWMPEQVKEDIQKIEAKKVEEKKVEKDLDKMFASAAN